MAFGLGIWRLPPAAFWALTPRELAIAWQGSQGRTASPPPRLADFADLLRRYPDQDNLQRS